MPLNIEELEKMIKLAALAQQAAMQLLPLIARLKEQGGETTDQILDHAQKANDEARKVIDSL